MYQIWDKAKQEYIRRTEPGFRMARLSFESMEQADAHAARLERERTERTYNSKRYLVREV